VIRRLLRWVKAPVLRDGHEVRAAAAETRRRLLCACGIRFRRQDDGDQQRVCCVQDEVVHVGAVEGDVLE